MPRCISLLAVLTVLLMGATVAVAAKPYWEGKPEFTPGDAKGYFIWHDDDGWHVRWTTKGRKHEFSGKITCDGAFQNVKGASIDTKKDRVKKIDRETIVFSTRVAGGRDGVDFRVSPRTQTITFELEINGEPAPTEKVRIGRRNRLARSMPFTIDRDDR